MMASPSVEATDVPWRVKDTFLGLALVLVGTMAVLLLLRQFRGDDGPQETAPLIALAFLVLPGLMTFSVWLFGVERHRVPWRALGLRRPVGRWSMVLPWLALLLSLTFLAGYGLVITVLGLDFLIPEPIPADALGEGVYRPINTVSIGVLGPIAEEVFFRGFMLAAMVRRFGTLKGSALGSAVFSASHVRIGVFVPFFVSGLLLAWLYLKTQSIWPPIVAHAAQNLLAISLAEYAIDADGPLMAGVRSAMG